jgi:hypothetical protein
MLGRRSFLLACGGITAIPAFARLAAPSGSGDARALAILDPAACGQAKPSENLVFRIDGWEPLDGAVDPADARATIRIGSSWQTAWH